MKILEDMDIDGVLGATTVKAEKIEIDMPEPDPDTGKSGAPIGEATITAGQTEVVVETTAVTDKSRVFVTATTSTGGQSLTVVEKVAGDKFKVILDHAVSTDVTFD